MASGSDRGIFGFVFELISWVPFLLILAIAGGASLLAGAELVEMPDWAMTGIDLYQGYVREPLQGWLLPDAPDWAMDAGFVALGLLSLAARTLFSFIVSVIAFAALAALLGLGGMSFFSN